MAVREPLKERGERILQNDESKIRTENSKQIRDCRLCGVHTYYLESTAVCLRVLEVGARTARGMCATY